MRKLQSAVAVAAVLTIPATVVAEERAPTAAEIREAAEAFDSGRDAFKHRDYAVAADYFEAADQNAPSGAALELAIRSRDNAGQLDRAATLSALALQRHPDERGLKKLADDVINRARRELHELTVVCSPACDVAIGSKLVHGRAAIQRAIFVPLGAHAVRAAWTDDQSASLEIMALEAGGASKVEFAAPAPEPAQRRDSDGAALRTVTNQSDMQDLGSSEDRSGWSPAVFWVGLGLTAVAGGVTTWSGIDTINNPGKAVVVERCAGQGTDCEEYQDGLANQRRTNALIGVTAGLGLTTLIVGTLLTDWGSEDDKRVGTNRSKQIGLTIQPWAMVGARSGATVGAVGRF